MRQTAQTTLQPTTAPKHNNATTYNLTQQDNITTYNRSQHDNATTYNLTQHARGGSQLLGLPEVALSGTSQLESAVLQYIDDVLWLLLEEVHQRVDEPLLWGEKHKA